MHKYLKYYHSNLNLTKTKYPMKKIRKNFCATNSISENHLFEITTSIKKIQEKYQNILNLSDDNSYPEEKIAGRILSLRRMSKDLTFMDINYDQNNLQIILNSKNINRNMIDSLKRGYIVGLSGIPFRTNTGELSLLAKKLNILAECKVELPNTNRKDKEMLINPELKYSKRYLDLIVNGNHRDYFIFRANLIYFIRSYLKKLEFLEVETPIMSLKGGGALAKPFTTYSNSLRSNMYLRVAPELYLKQLIIGGFERVYEIGKNFRNEDISIKHNPEFTSIEFYQTYTNHLALMQFTKTFLNTLVNELFRGEIFYMKEYFDESNYKTFDVINELETYFNRKFTLDNKQDFYNDIETCHHEYFGIDSQASGFNIKKKLEKLIEALIEPKCKDSPSFIINHPTILSPLAKSHSNNKLLSERFELFINGMEVINAYSELTDPVEQKERFIEQKKLEMNDEEVHPFDNDYIEALAHGMPPTGGWGMGIDRLCMILLNKSNIKDVILFPLMNVNR